MEKIWEELKKIERGADLIRFEALDKSKEMIKVVGEESEKLISDSKKQANEEAKELLEKSTEAANEERVNALKKNEEFVEDLRKLAEKRMDEAVKMIFDAMLGKTESEQS